MSTFARIGETEAQVQARYGKPIKTAARWELDLPGTTKMYKNAGLTVIVTFIDGTSQREQYSKDLGSKLGLAEVETILAANAGNRAWSEIKHGDPLHKWSSTRWTFDNFATGLVNQSANGLLADFDDAKGILYIASNRFLRAMSAKGKADAEGKLKDF